LSGTLNLYPLTKEGARTLMAVRAKIREAESNLKEFGITEKYGKFTRN